MINPKDIELLDTEEGRLQLDPEFVEEFSSGKGSDEEECESNNEEDDEDGSDADIQ